MFRSVYLVLTAVLFASGFAAWPPAQEPAGRAAAAEIKFVTHRIGTFRSEACGVSDFNGDGRLDVVAGPYLYLAPDWKPVKIRTLPGSVDEQGKGYYDDFMNLPLDVDGDGRPDVVSCGWFSKSVKWFRNTLGQDGEWPLAQEIVARFHSQADAVAALADFEARFQKGALPDEMPELTLASASIAQVLKQAGLVASTSEALRMIDGGGVRANGERVSDKSLMLGSGETVVLQVGKRKFARITLT